MEQFATVLLYGLVTGGSYVLVAVGFGLIYGIMHKINFAHGEMFMLGAYLTFLLSQAGLPYLVSAPLAVVIVGVVGGWFVERVGFRPLRQAPPISTFVSTLALALLLSWGWARIFGAEPVRLDAPATSGSIDMGIAIMSLQRILVVICGLALIVGLQLYLKRTDTGRVLRAAAQDEDSLKLLGVDVQKTLVLAFVLASALAAAAGALMAPLTEIHSFMGVVPLLKAFVVVVLGGFGNLYGTAIAGFLLGIYESVVAVYLSPQWVDTMTFALMIVVLIARPAGLVSIRRREV